MNLAGKYVSLAQGVAEAALLKPLRAKYKMPFNLELLSQEAKQNLRQANIPVTPSSLLRAADDIAARREGMLTDTIGTEMQRWNPARQDFESYVVQDPRAYFVR